jgi:hypothetical protein
MEAQMDAKNSAAENRAGRCASATLQESLEHGAGGGQPFLPVGRKMKAISRMALHSFRVPKGLRKARRLAGEGMTCLAG